jgi:hypothetical protein
MEKRLFDYDPLTGITRWFHFDEAEDAFYIETEQETQGLVDQNRREANEASSGWSGDWHKVASIPLTIYMDLVKKGIVYDQNELKKWLNDPNNAYFRTKHGSV